MEESYGIDHKLIELNNLQRSFLGKKSEYVANKVMKEYINKELFFRMNVKENTQSTIKFYYETNNFIRSSINSNQILETLISNYDNIIQKQNETI